jgi:hypothetical protein
MTGRDKWILKVMCWSDYGAMKLMEEEKKFRELSFKE